MGTTWRDRKTAANDREDSRTVTTWSYQDSIDLRDARPVGYRSADEAMVEVLVHIAAAGVDDKTSLVFLRCWSTLTSDSSAESAAALADASASLRGSVDPRLLLIVDRWIEELAPLGEQRRSRLRRFFVGQV